MRVLLGSPVNVKTRIIGKVTRNPFFLKRRDLVFISRSRRCQGGYAAELFAEQASAGGGLEPFIHQVKGIDTLKEGDIVAIEPDGKIGILYERHNMDNFLMLTERCNSSCLMCPQPPSPDTEDRTEQSLKIISLMDRSTACLGLSGGEPTLLEDKLFQILKACKYHLPRAEVTLLTNGMKFSDFEYTKKLIEVGHSNLIIDIPIYSDTDTEHNNIIRAKGFYKTIQGLYNLALFNQRIGIRIVVHKMNYKRLLPLAEFIYHNFPFVFHVAFMQMEPTGLARQNIEQLWIDPHDYNPQLEDAVRYLARRDVRVSIYNSQLCILPLSLQEYARKSISLWKDFYLEECENCDFRTKCGGFFASARDWHSRHVHPIKT